MDKIYRVLRIVPVMWLAHASKWIKINTNGASSEAPGPASCGGILCNCRGFVKGCFSISIDLIYAFDVELQ